MNLRLRRIDSDTWQACQVKGPDCNEAATLTLDVKVPARPARVRPKERALPEGWCPLFLTCEKCWQAIRGLTPVADEAL